MAREVRNLDDGFFCCLCSTWFKGFGNNPHPLCADDDEESLCCNDCNVSLIIPARMRERLPAIES